MILGEECVCLRAEPRGFLTREDSFHESVVDEGTREMIAMTARE